MKTYFTIISLLLFLSACQKIDNNDSEPTIDYATYKHVINWTEIGSKTGESDWQSISGGKILKFFTNSDVELGVPNNGVVLYTPGVSINIKNEASFKRSNNTLEFSSYPFTTKADTVVLVYKLLDNSTLVISDTSVTPTIEIKYKRDN